jgi:glycerol uptake facilitator-like aquaporin
MNPLEIIQRFIKSNKGATEISDKIIGLIIGGFILFSLFGSVYTAYVTGNPSTTYCPPYYNASSPCPPVHIAMYGIIMTMLIIAFVLLVWRSAKSGK